MKSVEVDRVKLRLHKTPDGYAVTRGTWSRVEFETYAEADEFFSKE